MNTPQIRIVTVTFNPGDELRTFAASLSDATLAPYELVIVDNGKESEVVDAVVEEFGAILIRPGVNRGYGGAVNLGAAHFCGEWIVVANPDLMFEPGCLDAVIESAQGWPRGGAFGPLIRTPEGEIYPSARRFPRLVSGAGHALLAEVWQENPFSRAYRENAATGMAHAVDWLSGACLIMRREAFDAVGGFDDSYFMFFEDTQLGEDLRAAGWQSVFVPEGEVVHEQGTSWQSRPAQMLRAHHASAAHYLDGIYNRPWQAPLRGLLHAGLYIRGELRARFLQRGKTVGQK